MPQLRKALHLPYIPTLPVSVHSLQSAAKDDGRIREDGEFSTEGACHVLVGSGPQ